MDTTTTNSEAPSTLLTAPTQRQARPRVVAETDPSELRCDRADERLQFADSDHDDPRVAVARMTLRPEQNTPEAGVAMATLRADMPRSAAVRLSDYTPDLPEQHVVVIRGFVEDAVALALPQTSYSVETLLRPVMHFVYWAVFVIGSPLDAAIIFERELIEHYIRSGAPRRADGTALADGTLRNYRAWVFRVAEAANPARNPRRALPLNARQMDAPYDADEEVGLGRWAKGQKSRYMRQGAATLIALAAGAGLKSSEIVLMRREDVTVDEDGTVTITVTDGARTVVMTAQYERRFAKILKDVPTEAFVFLPNRNRTKNDVVSAFVGRSTTPSGSPSISARRLRNTWLVGHLTNRVDAFTLMEAAGLQSLESISRLAIYVARPSNASRIAQLRGTK
jgi:integrase